jgi:hypothetical protein
LLIISPFPPIRRPGRNNADDLDQLPILVFIPNGVRHQQQKMTFNDAERLPALLPALNAILFRESEGIGEYPHGGFETDAMFAKIARGFGGVPFETDPHCQLLLQKRSLDKLLFGGGGEFRTIRLAAAIPNGRSTEAASAIDPRPLKRAAQGAK